MGKPKVPRDPHIDHLYKVSDQLIERTRLVSRRSVDLSRLLTRLDADSQKLTRYNRALSADVSAAFRRIRETEDSNDY